MTRWLAQEIAFETLRRLPRYPTSEKIRWEISMAAEKLRYKPPSSGEADMIEEMVREIVDARD